MRIEEKFTYSVTEELTVDVLCNKCGKTCNNRKRAYEERGVEWNPSPPYLREPLLSMREAGVTGEIIGVTPSFGHRDDEILEWLSEHPEVTHYVAFDDDRFDMGKLGSHFIHCFHTKGLTSKNAEEAKLALLLPR